MTKEIFVLARPSCTSCTGGWSTDMVSTFLTTWVLRERLQLASSTIQGRSTSGLGHKNIADVIKQRDPAAQRLGHVLSWLGCLHVVRLGSTNILVTTILVCLSRPVKTCERAVAVPTCRSSCSTGPPSTHHKPSSDPRNSSRHRSTPAAGSTHQPSTPHLKANTATSRSEERRV